MMLEAARVDLCQCHCHPRVEAARLTSTRCDFLIPFSLVAQVRFSRFSARAQENREDAAKPKAKSEAKAKAKPSRKKPQSSGAGRYAADVKRTKKSAGPDLAR